MDSIGTFAGAKLFYYGLSFARRIVRNSFGILVSGYHIFKPIIVLPETVEKTCCRLYSWMRIRSTKNYTPPRSLGEENIDSGWIKLASWQNKLGNSSIKRVQRNHSLINAREKSDFLCRYFMGIGAVPDRTEWLVNFLNYYAF